MKETFTIGLYGHGSLLVPAEEKIICIPDGQNSFS
jgi:hypothetical protein